MKEFYFTAEVKRLVTDTISLSVKADSLDEALQIADDVLQVYPEEHNLPGVGYVFIENRKSDKTLPVWIKHDKTRKTA